MPNAFAEPVSGCSVANLADVAAKLNEAVDARTTAIGDALGALERSELLGPSSLPGWSRLTIACHLRYGAQSLTRMTADALAGRPTSYYPLGRDVQRPATLVPGPDETPTAVVGSLGEVSAALADRWRRLDPTDWNRGVLEPEGQADLGRTSLAALVLLRLTEVEVHSTDLDLGLPEWSELFVSTTLPFRLGWLATRRSNHRQVDETLRGSWLLRAADGPTWFVTVTDDGVQSAPADDGEAADATIEGRGRDLLALLLGRPPAGALAVRGDAALAAAFGRAFPGP
ncbi:MAG TPA: maleylpyruvate isomerase N-terminal domain-containing protein [Acidimicrobiales bacterium]|nr:maleylpyruvate isomerase N-terminal domain-containing protein [Acidimicrobiales bacterium]